MSDKMTAEKVFEYARAHPRRFALVLRVLSGEPKDGSDDPQVDSENEQKALALREACRASEDGKPEGTPETLARCARMLLDYAPDCFPANEQGQVHFLRAMMEGVADEINAFLTNHAPVEDDWVRKVDEENEKTVFPDVTKRKLILVIRELEGCLRAYEKKEKVMPRMTVTPADGWELLQTEDGMKEGEPVVAGRTYHSNAYGHDVHVTRLSGDYVYYIHLSEERGTEECYKHVTHFRATYSPKEEQP